MARRAVEEEIAVKPKVETGYLARVCVAAYLVPGLGHLLLGRKGRALILFISIQRRFVRGLAEGWGKG